MISELEEKRRQVNEYINEYVQAHSTDEPFEKALEVLRSMGWKSVKKIKKPAMAVADKSINITR